jgi:ribulose-phosphate 3-epimerase
MSDGLTAHINPSILNADFNDLEHEIDKIADVSDLLHLDIMDNKFVPNQTFTFERAVEIINFSKLGVDAHLMIENPDELAPKYAQSGCKSVTFHFEAALKVQPLISNIRSNGARVGMAIKPNTRFEEIEKYLGDIDMLLIMTVEPGFGGQSFMHDQMDKVSAARRALDEKQLGNTLLQVDGGISEETISIAALAGADCFVAGSAVYRSDNPAEMVKRLRSLANLAFVKG